MKKIVLLLLFTTFLLSCSTKKTELLWNKSISDVGSQSSPRATDLNRDGVLDIVIGGGKNEYQESDKGVMAFDGTTGEILWQHDAIDQVYGSATFLDITGDEIKDIFIGGRSNQFYAIDGESGKTIWEWTFQYEDHRTLKYAKYNFHNAVLIPDQSQDGMEDLLVMTGGNSKAEPNSTENRFPGILMIINSSNGEVIAADTMPDGLESYTPPVYFEQPDGSKNIVFGTGGETINGQLYLCSIDDLKKENIKAAQLLAADTTGHGFIAPSTAVDLNGDGFLDIAAISHGSNIYVIDGRTKKILWEQNVPNTESSNAFAVGNFNNDDIPDLFTFVSQGVWPESKGSVQVLLDGKSGEIIYSNALGCTGFSSPVIYDLNDDGIDEAILSINEYDCNEGFIGDAKLDISTRLIAIDFRNNKVQTIDQMSRFKNIFSTPYIGDIDGDGYLDIVHCQYFSPNSNLLAFIGMQIKRISTSVEIDKPIKWGAYMGNNGNGVFNK